jgi:hypothetical protein
MRSSMLSAFWRTHVVFIQGNLLLARSIQLIRDGPPWLPRCENTAIRQERKLEIPRGTDSGYGKRRFQGAPLRAVRAPTGLTDNAFPKSSERSH